VRSIFIFSSANLFENLCNMFFEYTSVALDPYLSMALLKQTYLTPLIVSIQYLRTMDRSLVAGCWFLELLVCETDI